MTLAAYQPAPRRRAATARQSRWRARRRDGVACYVVSIDASVIALLVHLHWLAGDQATDPRAVEQAISELLHDAAHGCGFQQSPVNGRHLRRSFNLADLAEILKAQKNRCAACRTSLSRAKKHVDHIVPVARGGSNERANLQYLCQRCNLRKNAKDALTFMRELGRLL
jgi:hypothetical protein